MLQASSPKFKNLDCLHHFFDGVLGNFHVVVVVVEVITPPLPRDGGTVRTANQVHAVNLIEIRLEERWQLISNKS